MSIENEVTDVVEQEVEQSLDDFSAEFFETPKAVEEEKEVVDDSAKETPDEDNTLEEETETDEEEKALEEEPEAKPKKNRFQERIDELTAGRKEAERKLQETMDRLAALEQQSKPIEQNTPQPQEVAGAPQASDLNEDGTEKYPLGEFDPAFATDYIKYALKEERILMQEELKQEQAIQEQDKIKAELQTTWNEKLTTAKERYPDLIEKGENLSSAFEGIEPAYGDYLTSTIMSMEYGADVLYYLSNNLEEASKIVKSGATKATIALGRIESKFLDAQTEKQQARPKVSKAPVPPAYQNKGSSPAKTAADGDTDDLDAFAQEFFKKRK